MSEVKYILYVFTVRLLKG